MPKFDRIAHPGEPVAFVVPGGKRILVHVRFSGMGGGDAGGYPLGGEQGVEYLIGQDTLRENAMDNLDDLLGFDVVPATYIRATDLPADEIYPTNDYTNENAVLAVSVQENVPHAEEFYEFIHRAEGDSGVEYDANSSRRPKQEFIDALYAWVDEYDIKKIAILDYISDNTDRHGGNIVVDSETSRAYGIDHELTFGAEEGRGLRSIPLKLVQGDQIPPLMHEALQSMSKGDFYAALAGIDPYQIDAAWKRVVKLRGLKRFPKYEGVDD